MSIAVWLVPISPVENPTLLEVTKLVAEKIEGSLAVECRIFDSASVKSQSVPLWADRSENSHYNTARIWEWSEYALDNAIVPRDTLKLIVTDVPLAPIDSNNRFEIFNLQSTSAEFAIISIATLDPRYWFEVGTESRIKKITRRLHSICLRVIGLQLGLSTCHENSCPMFKELDSIAAIDRMTEYCTHHSLVFKERNENIEIANIKTNRESARLGKGKTMQKTHEDRAEPDIPKRPLRVFLCHSSSDKPTVRDLYRKLKTDRIEPWLDEENLLPGQEWQQEIPKAVHNSDAVLVCLSNNSVNKSGYLQKEIKYILDVADEQPEGTIFLIPLKLEECQVPERLRRWQWVNFFETKGYDRILRALQLRADNLGLLSKSSDSSSTTQRS